MCVYNKDHLKLRPLVLIHLQYFRFSSCHFIFLILQLNASYRHIDKYAYHATSELFFLQPSAFDPLRIYTYILKRKKILKIQKTRYYTDAYHTIVVPLAPDAYEKNDKIMKKPQKHRI